jgi:putative endonuclease
VRAKHYCVYILTNRHHTVLYTGVTNDLLRRIDEHKTKAARGFTARYAVDQLVYMETYETPQEAIDREKQIKAGSRRKKIQLIEAANPKWRDLSEDL